MSFLQRPRTHVRGTLIRSLPATVALANDGMEAIIHVSVIQSGFYGK